LIGEEISLSSRVIRTAYTSLASIVYWVVVPGIISYETASTFPTLPLSNLSFVLAVGGAIAGLQILGALTQGKAVSAVFMSGSYVTTAYYIWAALDGGSISGTVYVSGSPVTYSLQLKTALFLLVVPSLIAAVRAPLTFLLDQSEAGQPARDLP
jgi:hypothetical protein